jgi:hypothetical protein
MERMRQHKAELVRIHGRKDDPAAHRRWNQAYKLARYGLTQKQFDRLLEAQQYACGMCRTPFEDGQPIFIDHDHACGQMRSPRAASAFAGSCVCRVTPRLV